MSLRASNSFSDKDDASMLLALQLAGRGLGNVWPNPAVGCVLVRDGLVVGRGWTQPGGRPHAETQALAQAGEKAAGATAFVTLEPCSHHGKTPPCADALIAAGISRCVVAVTDSDPRVSGRGLQRLREAGVVVETGLREPEARALNAGFFLRTEQQRPLFCWKTATSLDGRIALGNGASQWITGPQARALTHRWRAAHDAVMVGVGTAVADDPALTCRLPGVARRPMVRIVLDSTGRLPLSSQLVQQAGQDPLLVITSEMVSTPFATCAVPGVQELKVATDASGRLSPPAVATALACHGLTRVMIEGGGQVAASFLAAGLIDRVLWFRGAQAIGNDGLPALAAMGLQRLDDAPGFTRVSAHAVGDDTVELYERRG